MDMFSSNEDRLADSERIKHILACMNYNASFSALPGDSELINTVIENRPNCFDYLEFPEYIVAINKGIPDPQFKGDRIIVAKDGSFHLIFRKSDGFTAKWGKTADDDPTHCPWGSEIADIEITTACSGIRGMNPDGSTGDDSTRRPCMFCYKSNNPNGSYMSFDKFKKIFDLINQPKTLTQIAFGVDAQCKTNPDVWKIMDYCIENDVTPNVTVADIDKETAENIVKHCGACAVSCYERNKNCCYDAIKLITDTATRLKKSHFKCNMHLMVSAETANFVKEVLEDRLNDKRLKNMHAIVMLSLKQKGRGVAYHKMDDDTRKEVINWLLDNGIAWGSDSCGANHIFEAIKDRPNANELKSFIEPCESFGMFSQYINVDGIMFPCSFIEGEGEWKDGIDLLKINDFSKEVWNGERISKAREEMIHLASCNGGCTKCPYYDV